MAMFRILQSEGSAKRASPNLGASVTDGASTKVLGRWVSDRPIYWRIPTYVQLHACKEPPAFSGYKEKGSLG